MNETQRLIDESAQTLVELATVSALDLCVLDGPRTLLFDAQPATAWGALDDAARSAAELATMDSLRHRGLIRAGDAIAPPLGLVLAAKTRPAFAVLADVEGTDARPMKMYAVSDETDPLQAMVVEFARAAPPGDFPHLRRLGVLGWFYRYVLVSPRTAADLLAAWAIKPPPRGRRPARVVSVYWHRAGEELRGLVTTVHGDGRTARVSSPSYADGGAEFDETGLRQVMTDLFTVGAR